MTEHKINDVEVKSGNPVDPREAVDRRNTQHGVTKPAENPDSSRSNNPNSHEVKK